MKKITKLTLILLALVLFNFSEATAQKFGHLNSGNLLEMLPDVKAADEKLLTYQQQLAAKGEEMLKAFQVKYQKISEEANSGKLSQIQIEESRQNLAKEQQDIAAYEKEMMQKIQQRREELLGPILNKVDEAIKAVGKEKGYQFIFETSNGAMLFVEDSEDVMEMVKAKLGI